MDDEQEHERFDVDNDYENGQFIGGEFYASGKRKKHQQTKEDQLYGVFAEGSDSDDDRRSKRGGMGGASKDFSRPVGFVSSGVVKDPEEAKAETAYDVQGPPPHGGLGFKSGGMQNAEEEEEEDEHGVLSTALGARWARMDSAL